MVDAPASKRAAAIGFMKAALAGFGKIESARPAKIAISGSRGSYTGTVDGGKVMTLKTAPVLGLDGKTPLTYSNIHDAVHPTVMQGKIVSESFSDGGHTFNSKGTNAFFNAHLRSSGKL